MCADAESVGLAELVPQVGSGVLRLFRVHVAEGVPVGLLNLDRTGDGIAEQKERRLVEDTSTRKLPGVCRGGWQPGHDSVAYRDEGRVVRRRTSQEAFHQRTAATPV